MPRRQKLPTKFMDEKNSETEKWEAIIALNSSRVIDRARIHCTLLRHERRTLR